MSLVLVSLLLGACGGGGGTSSPELATTSPTARALGDPRGISGAVANIVGTGLVLAINGDDDVSIPAGAESFAFPTLPEGTKYQITIKRQPSGQACTILRGAGIVGAADISDVTINCTNNVTDALVGTYVLGKNLGKNVRDFVTFNADGTFVVGSHENNPSCGVNEGNGIEYGVYNWNAARGDFRIVDVTLDTNDQCGLFNQAEPAASAGLLLRSPDGSLSLIKGQEGGGAERFVLKPVPSVPTAFVGSFGIAGSPDFIVLSSDRTYFVATTQADPVSGTAVGIEDACYTSVFGLGSSSGSFMPVTGGSCGVAGLFAAVDTNAGGGFSSALATNYVVPTPNTLTFNNNTGTTSVTRLLPNNVGVPDRKNILAGTYFSDLGVAGKRSYITFYADSTFVLGSHEDDASCGESQGNGVEYGVYRWDRATGAFRVVNVAVDTNDSCGTADDGDGVLGTLLKSPDGFTLTDSVDGEQMVFTVVLPVLGNPLIGSMNFGTPALKDPDFIVFTSDGRYFMASPRSDDGSSQNLVAAGIEDGCYNPGPTFVVDLGEGCTNSIDTNGRAGLTNFQGRDIPYAITDADGLALLFEQIDAGDDVQLTRIFPNSLDPLTGIYSLGGLDLDDTPVYMAFYDDGTFAVASRNNSLNNDPASEGPLDDVELGVYSWNQATGDFRILAKTLDTAESSIALRQPPGILTRSADGILSLDGKGGEDILFPVGVFPNAGGLIGGFFLAGDPARDLAAGSPRNFAVFSEDGTYFVAEFNGGRNADIGIEEGCYASVADTLTSGSLTPSLTRCLSVGDGRGTINTSDQGFADFDGNSLSFIRLGLNTLQLRFEFDFDIGGGGGV